MARFAALHDSLCRRHFPVHPLWRLWRHWRRTSAAVSHLPASTRSLSAAVSLLPAAIAAWRQPTPYFPQPKAPIKRLPAVKCQSCAPSTPVPAVNNGGSAATSAVSTIHRNKSSSAQQKRGLSPLSCFIRLLRPTPSPNLSTYRPAACIGAAYSPPPPAHGARAARRPAAPIRPASGFPSSP